MNYRECWLKKESKKKKMLVKVSRNYKLSPSQEAMLLVIELAQDKFLYNSPIGFRFKGKLNTGNLKKALDFLAKRHEVFRTILTKHNGVYYQSIIEDYKIKLETIFKPDSLLDSESWLKSVIYEKATATFNFDNDYLVRFTLISLSEGDHIFLVVFHHIIFDEWSARVFFREFTEIYHSLASGIHPCLPFLPIQYGEYCERLQEKLVTRESKEQIKFWENIFKNTYIPQTSLPYDKEALLITNKNKCVELEIEYVETIRYISKKYKVTPFSILISIYSLAIAYYSQEKTVVIGSPFYNRLDEDTENIIGYFVNTLPLLFKIEEKSKILDLFINANNLVTDIQDNQELPFDHIVRNLNLPRDIRKNPLFQTVFLLEKEDIGTMVGNLHVSSINIDSLAPKFDITAVAKMCESKIKWVLEYDTYKFLESSIHNFAGVLKSIADCILKEFDSELTISQIFNLVILKNNKLSYLTGEQYSIKEENLFELFIKQSKLQPKKVAIEDYGRKYTYYETELLANSLSHMLLKHGIAPGDVVGVFLERSAELIIAILSILKIGAVYLPIVKDLPASRVQYMVSAANPKLIITNLDVSHISCPVLTIDFNKLKIQETETIKIVNTPNAPAYILFTSGSTGVPKGVIGTHKGILNLLHWIKNKYKCSSEDRVIIKTSIIFGDSLWEIFLPLTLGATAVVNKEVDTSNIEAFKTRIISESISILILVPSILRFIINCTPNVNEVFGKLKYLLLSGEKLSNSLVKEVGKNLTNTTIVNLYGSSEISAVATEHIYDPNLLESKEISIIGKPIYNTSIYLLNDELKVIPQGFVGMLYVGGIMLSNGYLNSSSLSDSKFIKIPYEPREILFCTGDLVKIENETIEYLDRKDSQINLRGIRISLEEITNELLKMPSIKEAVTIFDNDKEAIFSFITLLIGEEMNTHADIKAFLSTTLPSYMLPKITILKDSIPKMPSGKIDIQLLKNYLKENLTVNYISPRDQIEFVLQKIFTEILGCQNHSIDDNFFDIGGHSLLVFKVLAKINDHFNLSISVIDFFNGPTIRALANCIRNKNCVQGKELPSHFHINNSSNKKTLILFPPASGLSFKYLPLGSYMDNYNILALNNKEFYDISHPIHTSINLIAKEYYSKVLENMKFEPSETMLAGYSFGGVAACEVAQLFLLNKKIKFKNVLLIDTYHPNLIYKDLTTEDEKVTSVASLLAKEGVEPNSQMFNLLQFHIQNTDNLCKSYKPKIYDFNLTLIKSLPLRPHHDDKYNGWEQYNKTKIRIFKFPVPHEEILSLKNIASLANIIKDADY